LPWQHDAGQLLLLSVAVGLPAALIAFANPATHLLLFGVMTVLFLVAGSWLGLSGTLGDNDTEKALAVFHNLKREAASSLTTNSPDVLARYYVTLTSLLTDNLGIPLAKHIEIPQEALDAKTQREQARKSKEWKKSDELRAKLTTLGYKVEDNPDGTSTLLPL